MKKLFLILAAIAVVAYAAYGATVPFVQSAISQHAAIVAAY
jgi:hypothetical protein